MLVPQEPGAEQQEGPGGPGHQHTATRQVQGGYVYYICISPATRQVHSRQLWLLDKSVTSPGCQVCYISSYSTSTVQGCQARNISSYLTSSRFLSSF